MIGAVGVVVISGTVGNELDKITLDLLRKQLC